MNWKDRNSPVFLRRTIGCLLALASLAAAPAWAIDCSELSNGVLDGFAGDIAPSQIQIDRNCTIRNFPAANPLTTNFSFLTQPGQSDERLLVVPGSGFGTPGHFRISYAVTDRDVELAVDALARVAEKDAAQA